jgi:hypothetical protein
MNQERKRYIHLRILNGTLPRFHEFSEDAITFGYEDMNYPIQ